MGGAHGLGWLVCYVLSPTRGFVTQLDVPEILDTRLQYLNDNTCLQVTTVSNLTPKDCSGREHFLETECTEDGELIN